jgi:hypothetical protein
MSLLSDVRTNRHPRFPSSKAVCVLANRQRRGRFAASAIKESWKIVFAITIFSTIMALLTALDIWIWVPLR